MVAFLFCALNAAEKGTACTAHVAAGHLMLISAVRTGHAKQLLLAVCTAPSSADIVAVNCWQFCKCELWTWLIFIIVCVVLMQFCMQVLGLSSCLYALCCSVCFFS